jgi:hypothetical protein
MYRKGGEKVREDMQQRDKKTGEGMGVGGGGEEGWKATE